MNETIIKFSEACNISVKEAFEKMEKVKEIMSAVCEKLREIIKKVGKLIKELFNNDHWIIDTIKKYENVKKHEIAKQDKRYHKRVQNRNRLYQKLRRLGRRL